MKLAFEYRNVLKKEGIVLILPLFLIVFESHCGEGGVVVGWLFFAIRIYLKRREEDA